jgi:glycerophosphoryl diester phosphodiesterase
LSSTCPEPRDPAGRSRIIAHRGASGYLPEHTAAAKTLAYGLGADFIEQDLVATKDQQLVVLHDTYLDDVSDVARQFPARRRDDGHFHVIDFTLAELAEIRLTERRSPGSDQPLYPGRFPYELDSFRVLSFSDEIRLIAGLNASTGRHAGLYPEIKEPAWHSQAGIDLTGLVAEALEIHRETISGPVFVQSFDAAALLRMRDEFATDLPLVKLLQRGEAEDLTENPAAIARIADYAVGIGLPYTTLIEPRLVDGQPAATKLAQVLADSGLLIHPYTMRRDVAPPGEVGYFEALRFLIHELKVDALFCDHPDDALAVREYTAA